MKKLKKIFQEFNGSIKDSKKIKFLKISQSLQFIFQSNWLSPSSSKYYYDKSLEVWSNKIFSNKISYKNLKNIPLAI